MLRISKLVAREKILLLHAFKRRLVRSKLHAVSHNICLTDLFWKVSE